MKKNDKKLHCQHCATLKHGTLGTLIRSDVPNEKGEYTNNPVFFNLARFNKMRRTDPAFTLPPALFFHCDHCTKATFYNLNKNGKLNVVLS